MRRTLFFLFAGLLFLGATRCDAQLLHRKKKVNKSTSADNTAEPDKVLYDRAIDDIKHGKHEVGRLNLQTLINTYPDSEYLAKAKLGIADSYYKEGGTANMTQAIQGYKDFIVFFPFLKEASYAQLQVAMAHYRQLEKPDRDRTQAHDAEDEFQTFLSKYPNDPLAPKAEQHLRDVQEVLAEGDYRIGYYYYVKGDRRAAAGRLIALTNRYPLYSKSDHALWMLGDIFQKSEKKDLATNYYARIVRDYPLSQIVPDAKSRLKQMGAPIPQADPKAVAWMTAEQNAPRQHTSLIQKPMGLLKSGPKGELQASARTGTPNLTPEADDTGIDILSGGNRSTIGGAGTGIVATVTPGQTAPASGTAESTTPAAEGSTSTTAPTDANPPAATTEPTTAAPAATDSTATSSSSATGTTGTADAPKTDAAASSSTTGGTDATKTDGTQDSTQASTSNAKNPNESSSKKKKGLKKLIPW